MSSYFSSRRKASLQEPMGIEMQTVKQHYIVSPHDDIHNLYANALGMSAHKISRNKPPLMPVFVSEKQRKNFHSHVTNEIMRPRTDMNEHEFAALSHLHQASATGNAKTDLQYLGPQSRVYVQGHGSAGSKNISSDSGQSKSSKDVAKVLTDLNLHPSVEVRANSCFSGTQTEIKNRNGFMNDFNQGNLHQEAGQWSETFAGSLQAELGKLGRANKVSGYLGATVQTAQESIGRGYVQEKHMSVDVDTVQLRRKDLRRSN
jgi:hypothetical protein